MREDQGVFRILGILKKGAELIGVFWFLVMFGAFLMQVFTRYVLNNPLGWTEEVCLIGYLWFVFWGSGLMVREPEHVRFDMVCQVVPIRVRRVFAIIVAVAMTALYLAGLFPNVDYVNFMSSDRTWILGIRFDYVFAVFIVFMVAYAVRNIIRLVALLGAKWLDELGGGQ